VRFSGQVRAVEAPEEGLLGPHFDPLFARFFPTLGNRSFRQLAELGEPDPFAPGFAVVIGDDVVLGEAALGSFVYSEPGDAPGKRLCTEVSGIYHEG